MKKSLGARGDVDGFDEASPIVKKEPLVACGRAAAVAGDLISREVELLRSIADSIGYPIPSFMETLEESEN